MLGHRLHEVELFLANTVIAQYFKCFGYGHQAHACRNRTACGACGGQHERRACPIPENLLKPKYCNCQGSHPAWASTCPVCQEAAKRAREAWISRPGKYEIPISTVVVCTVLSYPSIGLGREVEGGLVLAGEECQGVRRGLVEHGGGDT